MSRLARCLARLERVWPSPVSPVDTRAGQAALVARLAPTEATELAGPHRALRIADLAVVPDEPRDRMHELIRRGLATA